MGFALLKGLNIWVFNVEHGLASAIRTPRGKWILIDLGSSSNCKPLDKFIVPAFEKTGVPTRRDEDCDIVAKGECKGETCSCGAYGKYHIAQLILSHPHSDHLSEIQTFNDTFYSLLLTCPHSNPDKYGDVEVVNWEIVEEQNQNIDLVNYLKTEMLPGREPPNKPTDKDSEIDYMQVYWVPPGICEDDNELSKDNYTNNLSLLVYLKFGASSVLFCGDIMPDGMKKLIECDSQFGHDYGNSRYKPFDQILREGIDVLVVSHHGLPSAFSPELFATLKHPDSKVRSINIISKQSGQDVDSRYSSADYCEGRNNLEAFSKQTTDHLLIQFPNRGERKCGIKVGDEATCYFTD